MLKERISIELAKKSVELEDVVVNYVEANQLNTIGFNEPTFAFFSEVNEEEIKLFQKNWYEVTFDIGLSAPTYQQAFSFINRVYGIKGYTTHAKSNGKYNFTIYKWNFDNNVGNWEYINNISSSDTIKLAESACLKKLLELTLERISELT